MGFSDYERRPSTRLFLLCVTALVPVTRALMRMKIQEIAAIMAKYLVASISHQFQRTERKRIDEFRNGYTKQPAGGGIREQRYLVP